MVSNENSARDDVLPAAGRPWRRGIDVLDDYALGGVLSEQLADDLVNELLGLIGDPRPCRPRARSHPDPAGRPGPQPGRPPVGPPAVRPRLTLVRGGASDA